ncbi:MAG: hypothetical protein ACREF3_14455, partial [Acetobacteraceae bacterium]
AGQRLSYCLPGPTVMGFFPTAWSQGIKGVQVHRDLTERRPTQKKRECKQGEQSAHQRQTSGARGAAQLNATLNATWPLR